MEAQSLPRTGRLFLPRSAKVLRAFSDERLVEQVRRGNAEAFEALYDRHHRGILSFCRHMLGSVDEAEDAVQQAFISAYDALRADDRDVRLKPWLYTIARNRCLSILRARREQPAELEDVPTAGLSEQVQGRADLRELLGDLHGLPVEQREALVLSEVGGLSHAEVGAVLGCEMSKVKSLVFQARSSLIETRNARAIPCMEIREQLATATGGVLRRGPLRRHIRECEGCAEFRADVMRQRKMLAALLPVVPTLGLKKAALAAIGFGGGGGGGGVAAVVSSGIAVKVATAAVVAGVAAGGGLLLDERGSGRDAEAAGRQSVNNQAWPAPAAGTGPGMQEIAQRTLAKAPHRRAVVKPKRIAAAKPAHERHVKSVRRTQAAPASPSAGHGTKQPGRRSHSRPDKGGADPNRHHHQPHAGGGHAQSHPQSQPEPAPAAPPAPPAAPPAPAAPPEPDGEHRGNHNGWTQGRGHEHHEQDAGGYHVPAGHSDYGSSGGDRGGGHDGGEDHHSGGHHRQTPCPPHAPSPAP